jgi:dihydroorotase
VELIHQRAEQAGFCHVHCLGALTVGLKGEMLSEMAALRQIGCRGVSNGLEPIVNTLVLRRALEYASTCGLTVFLHPEDPWFHSPGGVHEGPVSTRLGLPGIPAVSETIALGRYLQLIEHTGVRAHFCRLSTARGAAMIAEAQTRGLPISADVCAHQLHMTDADVGDYNPAFHTRPPLRTAMDRDGLRAAIKAGTLNAICSDHQPHDIDAKTAPFALTEPGISAVETLLPLSLALATKGVADLPKILSALTYQPADILGVPAGRLAVDSVADLCIFDPQRSWKLSAENMLSKGHNTPLLGRELRGRVTHTFVNGKLVYEFEQEATQR